MRNPELERLREMLKAGRSFYREMLVATTRALEELERMDAVEQLSNAQPKEAQREHEDRHLSGVA